MVATMGEMIKVGMADLNICIAPDALTTLGLGSCVGVALYDAQMRIAGHDDRGTSDKDSDEYVARGT